MDHTSEQFTIREMNSDVDLFCELLTDEVPCLDGQPLTPKRLALWTDLSVKTISDYRTGKYNIPVRVWRELFKYVPDIRIANLILGGLCDVVRMDRLPDMTHSPEAISNLLDIQKLHHESMSYLAEILRDGRIDEADAERIAAYNKTWNQLHFFTLGFNRSLNNAFKESQGVRS